MSIAITEDHRALAETVRDLLSRRGSLGAARALLDGAAETLPATWSEFAELGWLGIHLPEQFGGSGYGVPELAVIVEEMGVRPDIDPAAEIEARVAFLLDYLEATGARGFVLGISGGLDSTLAGRLAQLAVERRRDAGGEARFVAMRLPYRVQLDEDDAQAALAFVAADQVLTYDVGPAVDGFVTEYVATTGAELSDFTKGNTKARLRMVAQYAVAGDQGLLVIGTDHGADRRGDADPSAGDQV